MMSVMTLWGKAQSNLVFYHLNDEFNSSAFNPAFLTSQKNFTFSIFPLAGMSFVVNNQSIVKDVVSKFLSGNQTNQDFKDVFTNLEQDLFLMNYKTNLLFFGCKSDFGSFSLKIGENVLMATNVKGDITDFLTNPTFKNIGIDRSQFFSAEALHYREYSFGFAKELIKDKLSIGIYANIYFGKSMLFSEVSGRIIERSNSFYIQIEGPMRLSIPANPQFNDGYLIDLGTANNFNAGKYITNARNLGAGIDLGFSYKISDKLELSASVIDLGSINWKNNIHSLVYKDEYPLPAKAITVTVDEHGVPVLTKINVKPLGDSISFKLSPDESVFSKPLPTTIYSGLKYQLNSKLAIGVVDSYIRLKGLNQNSFSITSDYDLNMFTFSMGYSKIGRSNVNVPFGMVYKWDSGQFYLGTDNLLSFVLPASKQYSGISFGTCFYLFNHRSKYKEQIDYLPFYKEKKIRPVSKRGLIFNNYD